MKLTKNVESNVDFLCIDSLNILLYRCYDIDTGACTIRDHALSKCRVLSCMSLGCNSIMTFISIVVHQLVYYIVISFKISYLFSFLLKCLIIILMKWEWNCPLHTHKTMQWIFILFRCWILCMVTNHKLINVWFDPYKYMPCIHIHNSFWWALHFMFDVLYISHSFLPHRVKHIGYGIRTD